MNIKFSKGSPNHLQVVYTIMAGGDPVDILKKIFRLFDVNSDGSISKKEMRRLVKDMYGLLKREDPNLSAADLVAKGSHQSRKDTK